MALTLFTKVVLEATRKIPRGRITTYGEIARVIGRPKAARAVGNALNKNNYFPVVPCHRVVKRGGEIGGFNKGFKTKIRILKSEGIKIEKNKVVNLREVIYYWDF